MKHNNEEDEEGEEEIDEEPLLKSLYEALHREIPDMPTFKQQEREIMIEMASKKNRFKGFKCELKPTSMDVHIAIKNLEFEKNYFDQSRKILHEKQQMLLKELSQFKQ